MVTAHYTTLQMVLCLWYLSHAKDGLHAASRRVQGIVLLMSLLEWCINRNHPSDAGCCCTGGDGRLPVNISDHDAVAPISLLRHRHRHRPIGPVDGFVQPLIISIHPSIHVRMFENRTEKMPVTVGWEETIIHANGQPQQMEVIRR